MRINPLLLLASIVIALTLAFATPRSWAIKVAAPTGSATKHSLPVTTSAPTAPATPTKVTKHLIDLAKLEQESLRRKQAELDRKLRRSDSALRQDAAKDRDRDDEDADGVDPDLPTRGRVQIDKGLYLRMRNDYFNLRRGIDPYAPKAVDPRLRLRALDRMRDQERQVTESRQIQPTAGDDTSSLLLTSGVWLPIGPSPLPKRTDATIPHHGGSKRTHGLGGGGSDQCKQNLRRYCAGRRLAFVKWWNDLDADL